MEDVMTPPLEGWLRRSTQRFEVEYGYKPKAAKPIKCKFDECASFATLMERKDVPRALRHKHHKLARQWAARARSIAKVRPENTLVRELAEAPAKTKSTEARFHELADEWSKETRHISSVSDLINDRHYQEIINLGWDVVPHLLADLQCNKRFWFPALAAITGVRPFDPGDSNNPRRMTEAWVRWGKRKGLI